MPEHSPKETTDFSMTESDESCVVFLAHADGPVKMAAIVDEFAGKQSTAYRAVDRLAGAGIVQREVDSTQSYPYRSPHDISINPDQLPTLIAHFEAKAERIQAILAALRTHEAQAPAGIHRTLSETLLSQ